ncbi:hypothetical protein [Streptomyces sp. NPDC001970]
MRALSWWAAAPEPPQKPPDGAARHGGVRVPVLRMRGASGGMGGAVTASGVSVLQRRTGWV